MNITYDIKQKVGRPLGSGKKVAKTISIDVDVLAAFMATGKGWQTRLNYVLKRYLDQRIQP